MTAPAPRTAPGVGLFDFGIFDSGLGGLSVLREVRRQAPAASVLYLADTANVPYGDKPLPVVRDLALRLTGHLVEAGVQVVLMASGTSTVAGLDAAQAKFPGLALLGTVAPGARAAVTASAGPIGVLATNATVQSLAFTHAVQALDPARLVIEQGCPRFVPLVESGQSESRAAEDAACEALAPLREAGVQSIILGCTHFPFLLPALHRAVRRFGDKGFRPLFVDPSEETVRAALPRLSVANASVTGAPGSIRFAATGDPLAFGRHASALLGEPVGEVDQLTL